MTESTNNSPIGLLRNIWDWLTEPVASIKEPDRRRQARLLASVLVVFAPLGLLLSALSSLADPSMLVSRAPGLWMQRGVAVIWTIAYGLNRTGRYTLAAVLTTGSATVAIFASAMPYDTIAKLDFLVYLVVFVLLSSVLLSTQATIILVAADAAAMLLLPVFFPQVTLGGIITGPLNFVLLMSVLVLFVVYHRNQLEADRQAELAEKKERYRSLLETTFEGIVISEKGRVVDANAGFARMFGYAPSKVIGMSLLDFFAKESRDLIAQSVETGAEQSCESLGLRKDGTRFHIELVAKALIYRRQAVRVVAIRNVTERKRAEEALRESEERFRALFENAPLCILEADLRQRPPIIVRANRQAEQIYGWSSEEFPPVPMEKLAPSEATPDPERVVNVLRAGGTITVESVHRRRDGSVFPVRISASSETAPDLSRVIFTIEDITAEKNRRSEEEAIAEERRRIAREIHDGLAQDLAALRLRARLWHDMVDHDPARMHAELDALRELLGENIRDVRRSMTWVQKGTRSQQR